MPLQTETPTYIYIHTQARYTAKTTQYELGASTLYISLGATNISLHRATARVEYRRGAPVTAAASLASSDDARSINTHGTNPFSTSSVKFAVSLRGPFHPLSRCSFHPAAKAPGGSRGGFAPLLTPPHGGPRWGFSRSSRHPSKLRRVYKRRKPPLLAPLQEGSQSTASYGFARFRGGVDFGLGDAGPGVGVVVRLTKSKLRRVYKRTKPPFSRPFERGVDRRHLTGFLDLEVE